MSGAAVIHERFMNTSRTILPRVGGGVGEGGGSGSCSPIHDVYRYARGQVMDAAYGGEIR